MTERVFKKGQVWLYYIGAGIYKEVKITGCKGGYVQHKTNDWFSLYSKRWESGSEFNKNAKQLIKDVQ